MSNSKFDVTVIGAGPGGYVAAIRAAQLGLKTAIIEAKHLGGICLNWGCIPTKAMLKGADMLNDFSKASKFGIHAAEVDFEIEELVKHSRTVSSTLTSGIQYLLNKNGVTVFNGKGELIGKERILFTPNSQKEAPQELHSTHIIIATGANPKNLPFIDSTHEHVWTYYEALSPKEVPESLLVIGSGAIGVEFASMYRDFGSDVTIVEMADRIVPNEDADVSAHMKMSFEKRGINCITKAGLEEVVLGADNVYCTIKTESKEYQQYFDKVLVAIGVSPNSDSVGLDNCNVKTKNGFIETDELGRTNVVGVYAIGDVCGAPCLAHKASHQAIVCVDALAGAGHVKPVDVKKVPGCTYCRPNIASIGLTEAQAKEAGHTFRIGRFDLSANGKALGASATEGFVKVIIDEQSEDVLGAHFVGHEVTEQIQGLGIAMSGEITITELEETIFAHPTISEAIHEAILDTHGKAIHK